MQNTSYSCPILIKVEFSGQILEKYSNIKFRENPSSGSRIIHANGQTDMTKQIVAFFFFAILRKPKNNEPKTVVFVQNVTVYV